MNETNGYRKTSYSLRVRIVLKKTQRRFFGKQRRAPDGRWYQGIDVTDRKNLSGTAELRRLAEERFLSQRSSAKTALIPSEAQQLVQELEIHKIELELQNEQLNAIRAQLEMALEESTALYDFSPVGSFTLDETGTISKLNLAGARLWGGGERARLLGKKFSLFVSDPERPAFIALFDRAMTSGDVQSGEISISGTGVPTVHVQIKIALVPETLGCQVSLVDITERKQAENLARASTDHLNEAQRIARVGSWTLDLLSGKLIWSDEIFRLFEIDPNQFGATYEAFLNAIHPEDRDAVNRAYTESLANRTPYEITHRLLMRDGRIKWVHERCTSDFDAAGKPLRSQGTGQDITERIQTEAALRESARLLDSVIQNLPVMLFLKRASDLRMVMFNKAGEHMLGFSRNDLLGKCDYDNFPKKQADFFTLKDRQVLDVSGVEDIPEEVITTRDGRQLILHTTKVALRDESGQPQYLLGISENITDRKQMEAQVRQLAFHDPLTKLPNRRLLNDRLDQAMAASKRSACYGALMFLDLDNFKPLNDGHGHDAGDVLLIEVADRLKNCVREIDTVGRVGGDEFVVLLSDLNADKAESTSQAGIVAEKIRTTLSGPYLLTLKHEGKADTTVEHRCTASIGVVLFLNHEASQGDILKRADAAMYQAKLAGRNLIRFHDSKA